MLATVEGQKAANVKVLTTQEDQKVANKIVIIWEVKPPKKAQIPKISQNS